MTVNRVEFAAFGTHPGNEEFLLIDLRKYRLRVES